MRATEIDPRFRQMGKGARRRRRRVAAVRWGGGLVAATAAALVGWWQLRPDLIWLRGGDLERELVQVEAQFDIAPIVRADTFTDIPGDPLIIPAQDDAGPRDLRQVPAPADLPRRAGAGGTVVLLDSALISRDRRLVATLPATREEFALFQAERSRARRINPPDDAGPAQLGLHHRASSGVAFLRDTSLRVPLWRELIVETTQEVETGKLLASNGFDAETATRLAARIQSRLGIGQNLPAGSVLAMRYRSRGDMREVVQISLYGAGGYLGSLAMNGAGQLVAAADPWADQPFLDDLLARQGAGAAAGGQQRLLDLIYSAALRNDVPAQTIGEALALMSRVHDLDSYADEADRLTLIYAPASGSDRSGAILFVGVNGPGGDRRCYVIPEGEDFACYAPMARVQRRGDGITLSPPVAGVLSQRFVPPGADVPGEGPPDRGHVVWSAPEGSPVIAAGPGRITARLVDDARGAQLEITHDGGVVSRYSGLATLSFAAAADTQVAAGAVIGSVGRPHGQAAPGLVFQLLSDGVPVDPLAWLGSPAEVLASDAIEALIGRIITVESAGNAAARNPLSTATGLGQFIESTWLRMMQSHRPEIARSLSRRELLELRLDPELSRQMVRHLAQENEAFLRARGHAISPGRLYLAHFLGPGGADQALRADASASVLQVMGPQVVSANPFLRGYSIADLRNWADRKMTGAAATPVAQPRKPPVSPEIRAYVEALDRLRSGRGG